MSRFTHLAIVLSLAACEHAAPTSPPQFPERPVEPTAPPAPAPVAEPAVAPVAPAPAPKKLVKKCNPMSRAGCRWVEETDERELPRVTKKSEQVQ